ncbi:hypothetical protein HYY75_02565, partial [bacterium]|nr:hypothetical protein [bacterium]
MSVDFQVFTDESQARKALVSFLEPGCAERWFVFDSPDPNPVNNCLCWHDYRNLKGAVSASIRFSLLDLSYHQPFSGIKRLLFNFFGAKIHKSVYISPKVI